MCYVYTESLKEGLKIKNDLTKSQGIQGSEKLMKN